MALTAEQQALDFNPELQDVSRQRKLADLLMSQGMQQPQGQMISGYYVAPSITQQLNPLANILAGEAIGNRADTKQTQMAEALRVKGDAAAQDVMETYKQNPQAALAKATQYQQFPQVKVLLPQLSKVALPEATTLEREFAAVKAQGYQGSINDFKNQMSEYQKSQAANDKQRLGLEGARLNLEQQKAAQELQYGKPLTESQSKATNFGVQMAGSIGEMAAVEKAGFNPATTKNQTLLSLAGSKAGNMYVSPEVQRYKQGMDNFTENYIRFKSGANVPMHEIEKDLKNMMPEVGDTIDKLNQKQRARERALQGMAISAGPGVKFIQQTYQTEAPGMLNQAPTAPAATQQNATPNLWGKATVVSQ